MLLVVARTCTLQIRQTGLSCWMPRPLLSVSKSKCFNTADLVLYFSVSCCVVAMMTKEL